MGNAQLYKAAKDNDIETVRQCLDHGVNPNQKGKVSMYVCMYVWIYVHVCIFGCMYVCLNVCIYVC
jgi:hypothetical protein